MSSTILDAYMNYLIKPEGEERIICKNINICLQIEMLTQKWSRRNDLSLSSAISLWLSQGGQVQVSRRIILLNLQRFLDLSSPLDLV